MGTRFRLIAVFWPPRALDVRIAGRPLQLLTGELKNTLQIKEHAAERMKRENEADVRRLIGDARPDAALLDRLQKIAEVEQEVARVQLAIFTMQRQKMEPCLVS